MFSNINLSFTNLINFNIELVKGMMTLRKYLTTSPSFVNNENLVFHSLKSFSVIQTIISD